MKRCQLFKVALLTGVAAFACSSFGAAILGVNLTNTITASMDGGAAKSGDTWYELGVNAAAPTTGIKTGLFFSQTDPFSEYLIQPAKGMNALMLDTNRTTGSLTFTRPVNVVSLSLAGASGHGTGTNVLTLHFSDATTSTLSAIVGDWFNQTNRLQTSNGRINIFANTFDNVNSDNPRILGINLPLATADQSKLLTGIDFSWTGSAGNTVTALFGVSGDFTGSGHYGAIPITAASFNQDMIVGLLEVPEPGTMGLAALGAVMLLLRGRRNNR